MPIQVTCECGKAYAFDDKFAGRRAKCPACGATVAIPGEPPQPQAPEPTSRFARTELIAFGVVGAAVIGVVVVLLVCFLGGPEPQQVAKGPTEPEASQPSVPAAKEAAAPEPAAPEPAAPTPEEPAPPAPEEPATQPATPEPPEPAPAEPPEPAPAEPPEAAPAEPPEAAPAEPPPPPKPPPKPKPKARFQVEPVDPAAIKSGAYADRQVCWKGTVQEIKSRRPCVLLIRVLEQPPLIVDAEVHLTGSFPGGVDKGVIIVFEGTADAGPAGPVPEGAPTTVRVRKARVDLGSLVLPTVPPAPAAPETPPPTPAPPP